MSSSFDLQVSARETAVVTATAGQTAIAITFPFQSVAELVIHKEAVDGTRTTLLPTSGFTATGAGSSAGGTATLVTPAAAGEKYRVAGAATIERRSDMTVAGRYNTAALEGDLDKGVIIDAELKRDLGRTVRAHPMDPALAPLPAKTARLGKRAVFDGVSGDLAAADEYVAATDAVAGLMSAADKAKLDGITGAARPLSKTLVIFGSSNAAGVGASTYTGDPAAPNWTEPPTSWAGLLRAALTPAGWTVFNRSITGTATATGLNNSISRFWTDVAPHRPSHVILCTALHNEGYDPVAFVRNLATLCAMVRSIGAIPIVRGPSPYNHPTPASQAGVYDAMCNARNGIEGLDVFTIDALATLDDGAGKFAGGATYHAGDGLHCNDAGYAQLYDAIDLGIFTYGATPPPAVRPGGTHKIDAAATGGDALLLSAATGLAKAIGSFTMRARVGGVASGGATGRAFLSAYINGTGGIAPLRLRNPSSVLDLANRADASVATSAVNLTNSTAVRDLVVVYKAPTNTAYLYIDGALIGSGTLLGAPAPASTFVFGARIAAEGVSAAVDYRFADCQLWNVPLSALQVAAMALSGVRPRSGLVFDGSFAALPGYVVPNLVQNGLVGTRGVAWAAVANM